jgi:hypothetical protein
MPSFKEMSQQQIQEILNATNEKGEKLYPDVLTPLADKEEALFKESSCPKCDASATVPVIDARRPFTPRSPLPRRLLRCAVCGTEFDPYTRLITFASIIDEPG